jgi:hypothetical protein
VSLVLLLAACNPPVVPFANADIGPVDAARPDIGPVTLRDTGPRDTGALDMGTANDAALDAPALDANLDAGARPQITFDGRFDEAVWTSVAGNVMQSNSQVAHTPYDGDSLMTLYYTRDADWLYFGFEGAIVSGDAVVFYVDTAPSPPNGVFLQGTGLGDSSNVVNGVLSLPLTGTVEFAPEWGWGTSVMPIAPTTYDPRIGWRALASTGPFTPLTRDTTSYCSATACEVATRLAAIGATSTSHLTLIVRMGRPGASGGFVPTQAFPVSDSGTPEAINAAPISVVAP